MAESLKGKVQTVLGLIEPEQVGMASMHEHILIDLAVFFIEPAATSDRYFSRQPISLETLHWVRYNPTSCLDNCSMTDEKLMCAEVARFKAAGGGTIVEVTTIGLNGDPLGVARIARTTGVNIVKGTGLYIGASQPQWTIAMSEEQLAAMFIKDIRVGIGDTGVKAGVIGEMGCTAPLMDIEIRALRAAGAAASDTGAMINIHPSHAAVQADLVLENIRLCIEGGADAKRIVISHIDCMRFPDDIIAKILDKGCCIEYDTFGYEGWWDPYFSYHQYMPTDQERIEAIKKWIARGYISQICIACDHAYKMHLAAYGGGGYDHIIRNVTKLMRTLGLSPEQISVLLVDNPKRMLTLQK